MDLRFLLAFLLVFYMMMLPVLGQNYSFTICPENFACQNLYGSSYSWSEPQSQPCGLCSVICDASAPPKMKLDPWSDKGFDVLGKPEVNVIKLHDPTFKNLLLGHHCDSFIYDMPIPKWASASISYTIVRNITLFKCGMNPDSSEDTDLYFRNYNKTEPCGDFKIYYWFPTSNLPHNTPEHLPPDCSAVHLPMVSMDKVSNARNLFELLTADFEVQWHLSGACNGFCDIQVDQLKSNEKSEFLCGIDGNSTQGKRKQREIIIGTCLAGGTFLIVLVIFLVLHKKREGIKGALFFISRKSSEPSSKLDLEGGSSIYFGIPVFSYGELEKVTNNFDVSKELGSGGFGSVYYGQLHDGREVAVKRLYEHNFKRMAQFLNEVEILTRLRHPNLVSLYGCTSRRSRELLLVYEYIPNGTVADHLHGDRAKDQSLPWPVRMNISIQTAGALAYLHASDIIHRDVKTNNILLDHNFQVKVADFGLSRLFPNDVSHISTAPQGTPGYVDPEYHQCYQLTDKSDVYSFGVVLIELLSSMPAVDISRHRHEINLANLAKNRIQRQAFSELIDPSLGYDSDPEVSRMTISVAELAFRCVQLEKEMRPTMDEVLENLKAIQDCNKESATITKETYESRGRMVPSSPELDDVVLIKKNIKFISLPDPQTDPCVRHSTKTR